MSKLFTVVGITTHNGNAKVRFTDDMARRIKQFTKGGATRCDFVELPTPMSKLDALRHMQTLEQFQSVEDQATINDAIADREKESSKGEVKVKVTAKAKTKAKAKPSLDAIKSRAKKQEVSAADVLNAVTE